MMSPPPAAKSETSNAESARILYTLAFSQAGEVAFQSAIKQFSKTLVKQLRQFKLNLDKSVLPLKMLESEVGESKTRTMQSEFMQKISQISEMIDVLEQKLLNVTHDDVLEIKARIDATYFIAGTLTLQGFIIGIYEWLRKYLKEIYDLIEYQQQAETERLIQKEIYKKIPAQFLGVKANIKEIFGAEAASLQNLAEFAQNDPEFDKKINRNKFLLAPYIKYRDDSFLRRIAILSTGMTKPLSELPEAERQASEKAIEEELKKLKARIDKQDESTFIFIKDRKEEYDKEIFSLIELLILQLIDMQKYILPKSLRKTLSKL